MGCVASFTGAWIETQILLLLKVQILVASFTGAWIETDFMKLDKTNIVSRILYGCVDWNLQRKRVTFYPIVASFTGAWIETCNKEKFVDARSRILYGCVDWNTGGTGRLFYTWKSHPLRVRGLKRLSSGELWLDELSHPLRVRGLKQLTPIAIAATSQSHPLRVRGLKPDLILLVPNKECRILYGCVDWNC